MFLENTNIKPVAPVFANPENYKVSEDGTLMLAQSIVRPSNEISFMDFSSFERAWKTAEMLSKARCIPKEFWDNPSDILVIVQSGHELGLSPMVAIQNMMIVNSRPSIYGVAMLAICARTKFQKGGFIDCIETYDEKSQSWFCTVKRDGREPITSNFTLEDAKMAGLINKPGSWSTHRKRMMQYKSRGPALNDMFPDILKGIPMFEDIKYIENEQIEKNKNVKNTVESMKERLGIISQVPSISEEIL